MPPSVSIIVPAHNASATLGDTLQSLLDQSYPHWEAIVIENGSTDDTSLVAARWAAIDARIRVTASEPGVSRARNAGLRIATHPWILFLDADDWIRPTHLERLMQRLEEDPTLDAAHCGWQRIAPDGSRISEDFGPDDADLFPRFAKTCALTIHSCITRRSLIEAAGFFDPGLKTCEDWDLWQRIARLGCRFGAVREALACYRIRPGSASMNASQLVSDCRQVIERGYSSDARVASPKPEYINGLRAADKEANLLYTVAWAAGLAIGRDQDATSLISLVTPSASVTLDPGGIADCIYCCALLPRALPTSSWADYFETLAPRLREFLDAFERHIGQVGLSRSVQTRLAQMAINGAVRPRPFTAGTLHAAEIDVTQPIPDLVVPATVERLHCSVRIGSESLGVLELPVFDGIVPSAVLADAIAAEFAWPLLGRFFQRSLYPRFESFKEDRGWCVRRDAVVLGSALPGNGTLSWLEAHDHIGWTAFLQEVWGDSSRLSGDFYLSQPDRTSGSVSATGPREDWLLVEISETLPAEPRPRPRRGVVLTVGGSVVAQVTSLAGTGSIGPEELRAKLTAEAGFELCCAAVREGIIGRPFEDGSSLRERLSDRARSRRSDSTLGSLAPKPLILRRRPGACGTSASRRCTLPSALIGEVAPQAASNPTTGIVYLPDEVALANAPTPATPAALKPAQSPPANRRYSGEFFEDLFNQRSDPWHYQSPYEQTKYAQTLALLPRPRFGTALEIACAEGHFTRQLSVRVDRLTATDISPTALRRAAARCEGLSNISFSPLDVLTDPLPGRFDLIVCSEVLYFLGNRANLDAVLRKIAGALEPDGYFVTAHAHLVADEPHRPGFDWDLPFGAKGISEALGAISSLSLVRDLRTPLYRIQVYQRRSALRRLMKRRSPEKTLLPQPTELPPHAASHALWRGGVPQRSRNVSTIRTPRLPILMYHQLADGDPQHPDRYTVSPSMFEQHLQLLASRGYRSVSLEEWRRAMFARRPLDGRCVAITFDDGYRNFLEHAWPLLQRYGYAATMFLPTQYIGHENTWDQSPHNGPPLLTWAEIRKLQIEGVEFGAHSVTHPLLTSLSPTEVAREALLSRTTIEKELRTNITAFAYPYGDVDRVVEKVIGACGFTFGVTCEERPAELTDRLLALPRLEVRGEFDLGDFAALLPK